MPVFRTALEKFQGGMQLDGLYLWDRKGTLTAWESLASRRGFRLVTSAGDRIMYERTTNLSMTAIQRVDIMHFTLMIYLTPTRRIRRVEFARSGVILNSWAYVTPADGTATADEVI